MFLIKEFQHMKIQLEDIILATDNFGPSKLIGRGGFGPVYKGELSRLEGRRTVAFKRLDRKHGQGDIEFWKEILMLSKLKHGNLISLLHFCFEGNQRILVYEYASLGSLDHYLGDSSLTWIQRLKICIEAARAINYLHDPKGTQQRVLHRDIKSANILLDENWTAKVSDFGLSKIGLANQSQTFNISNAVGTRGYCDPLYNETGLLTKESDVYSFGVVLFEVMCGKLCYEYRDNQCCIFVSSWRESFDEKTIDDIIFHALKGQMDDDCLKTFSTIAYRCLDRDHKKRPMMLEVVKELEAAHEQQVKSKKRGQGVDSSGTIKPERLSKSDDEESGQSIDREHILKAKIAKIIDKGGLVDLKGVKELIQLMQTESGEKSIDLACRNMLVNVISLTDKNDSLAQFIQCRGLSILDKWLQELHEVKIDTSSEEFLFALFLALDRLPVNLQGLQTCNIGKSVDRFRDHENPQVQTKAMSLVKTWKKRVEVDMASINTSSSSRRGGYWPWPNN